MMMEEPRIGVYVCHCGVNIAGSVDVKAVKDYAAKLPNVVISKDDVHVCAEPGQRSIKEDVQRESLNRVVIAACSPRMHEPTFQRTLKEADLNPYLLEVANIREQCSWPHSREPEEATEKAKGLVRMAVARAANLQPLEEGSVKVERSAVVIGGGISGIQAALKLADAGFKVYLVEKEPSIGGHMAQLDKSFPTLDCAACILTPLMVSASHHPNINLLTHTEVTDVSGFVGDFKVKAVMRPRYINEAKCTGCGTCASKCPVRVPNEFEVGMGMRKAVFVPFAQSVPLIYTIDRDHCLFFQKGVCRICERFCPAGAVDYNQKPQELELSVGTIIVATGFDEYEASQMPELGFGRYKDVITGLQFERLSNAGGPTGGRILRPSDQKPPKSASIFLCVGSRSENENDNSYCSRYCCMAGLKHAYILKSLGMEVSILYMDLRAFGKGYEDFYRKVRDMGVNFIRGKPSDVRQLLDGSLSYVAYDTIANQMLKMRSDLIVLEAAMEPKRRASDLARILKIPVGSDGFFSEAHVKLRPAETVTEGIFIAGTCHGPKDIVDTTAYATGAGLAAASLMSKGTIEVPPIVVEVDELYCSGCRVCESLCEYGAIEVSPTENVAKVTPAKCKGCGVCTSACPSKAIKLNHFTDQQILAMVQTAYSPHREA